MSSSSMCAGEEERQQYRVHVATWNVGSQIPDTQFDLTRLVHATYEDGSLPDIVIVGMQEIVELSEVGAYVNLSGERSTVLDSWAERLGEALDGFADEAFTRILTHQLVGVGLVMFVRTACQSDISRVQPLV